MRAADITDKRFGRLVAKSRSTRNGRSYWLCECDCGNKVTVAYLNLGRCTFSCGCLRSEACKKRERAKNHPTHGVILSYYKRNAKMRNLEWSLSPEVFTRLVTGDCFYCGAPPRNAKVSGRVIQYSGVDRVRNELGYIEPNCVSCCTTCNKAKLAMSLDEFRTWVLRVAKRMNDAANLVH